MNQRPLSVGILLFTCLAAFPLRGFAQTPDRAPLRIVSAGPTGEVATIEDANEIRVVFSEPMVAVGTVPPKLKPSFFTISPAVAGTYRWSGTTILIFTPTRRLPAATKYDIRIAAGTAASSGRRLPADYRFSFTTPTARLLRTDWYRPDGRFDAAPIVVLRFNQPVKPDAVMPHLRAAFEPHEFLPPAPPDRTAAGTRGLDPGATGAFADKVQRASAAASSRERVSLALAKDWDRKRFPPAGDMVVVQLDTPIPPGSWVRIETDGQVPSVAGLAVSGLSQNYIVQVEPAFFVNGFTCAIRMRSRQQQRRALYGSGQGRRFRGGAAGLRSDRLAGPAAHREGRASSARIVGAGLVVGADVRGRRISRPNRRRAPGSRLSRPT